MQRSARSAFTRSAISSRCWVDRGEAIELGDEKGVAFADEVDSRFELRAFADSRYLLAEDLFPSRRREVAELGTEPRLLFDPRCPGVTDPQSPSPVSLELIIS